MPQQTGGGSASDTAAHKAIVTRLRTELIGTRNAIQKAAASVDKVAWNRLVAQDCVFVEPSGRIGSRASHEPQSLSGSAVGTAVKSAVTLSETEAHDHGDTAVLTYREDLSTEIGNNKVASATRYSEVYKRSGDGWQLIFSAETPILERVAVKVNTTIYDDYVGEYEIAPQLIGTVYREGEKLMLIGTGWKQPYELVPVAADCFVVKGMEQNEITFLRDEKGRVTHQSSKVGGQQQAMAKKIR